MKFPLAEIRPNPFRDMEHYPINPEKIGALRASIQSTGFWDNVVARQGPDGPEIAYGHHRLMALREEFAPRHEVDLIIRELSDEDMLRIMAAENMQEWASLATIEHETIAAVVKAYADGRIELPAPNARTPKVQVRHAPGYLTRSNGSHPYTKETVAAFLSWPLSKVERALIALAAIEAAEVEQETFAGLGSTMSERVVQAAHATERRAREQGVEGDEAKALGRRVATSLADEFRDGGRAIGTAITDRRNELIDEVLPTHIPPVFPAQVADKLSKEIEKFWTARIKVNDRSISRRDATRLFAANQNTEGIRHYAGAFSRVLTAMAAEADALASLFDKSHALEEVS